MDTNRVISSLKTIAIPLGGIIVAGVLAFATYKVDTALHQRDFNDLVEELAELDSEFEEFRTDTEHLFNIIGDEQSADYAEINKLAADIALLNSRISAAR